MTSHDILKWVDKELAANRINTVHDFLLLDVFKDKIKNNDVYLP